MKSKYMTLINTSNYHEYVLISSWICVIKFQSEVSRYVMLNNNAVIFTVVQYRCHKLSK